MNIEHTEEENNEDEESVEERSQSNSTDSPNTDDTSSSDNSEMIQSTISSAHSTIEISPLSDLLSNNVESFVEEISHYFPHDNKKLFKYENLSYEVLTIENNSSKPDNPNLLRYFINIIEFMRKEKKFVKKEIIHPMTGYFAEGESTIVYLYLYLYL